jgi:hypothetical protein
MLQITPEIEEFIEQARRYGMDDAMIANQLTSAGWDAAIVTLALQPAMSAAPSVPATNSIQAEPIPQLQQQQSQGFQQLPQAKRKSLVPAILLSVLLVLLQLSTAAAATFALGESGNAPALSKVYRKTVLPLALNRTSGNVAISSLLGLPNLVNTPTIVTKSAVEIEITGPNGSTKSAQLPGFLARIRENQSLATTARPATTSLDRFFASTSEDSDDSVQYPIRSQFVLDFGISPTTISAGLTFNAAELRKSLPQDILTLLNPDFVTGTIESRLIGEDPKRLYLRTNLLPASTKAASERWLSYDLPADTTISGLTQQERIDFTKKIQDTLGGIDTDSKEARAVNALLQKITTDLGVSKSSRDGTAVAGYRITVTSEQCKTFANDPEFAAIREYLSECAPDQTLDIFLYLNASRGTPHQIKVTVTSKAPELAPDGGMATFTVTTDFDYPAANTVAPRPFSSEILSSDIESYLSELFNPKQNLGYTGFLSQQGIDEIRSTFYSETDAGTEESETTDTEENPFDFTEL